MRHFARVDNGLFDAVLNRCVDTDRLCMNQMMAIDATGGLGLDGLKPLATPRRGDPRLGAYVSSEVCSVNDAVPQSLSGSIVGMKSP